MEPRRPRPTVTPRRGFVRAAAVVALLALAGRGGRRTEAADAPAPSNPPQPAPAAARPEPEGTIFVRALRASGRPIVGAFVTCHRRSWRGGDLVRRTDCDGIARFDGLAPESYPVRVTDATPGFAPFDAARVARLEDRRLGVRGGKYVDVPVDAPRCDLVLQAPCRRVLGMVLDAQHRSRDVRGAEVTLFPYGRKRPSEDDPSTSRGLDRSRAVGFGVTDAKGRFDVCTDVERAIVEVRTSDGRRGWASFSGVRALVYVAPGGLVRCAGKVLDETGAAVVGATVAETDGFAGIPDVARSTTLTGEDGAFALDVACLDETTLTVTTPGGSPQTVTVRPHRTQPVSLVVARTTALRVVVVDDGTGSPVRGASVELDAELPRTDPDRGRGRSSSGTTDAAGEVLLPLPPTALADVRVRAPGYGFGSRRVASRPRGAVAAVEGDLDARMASGEERRVVLRLRRPTRVTGSLVAPAGVEAPAGTFTVRLAPRSWPQDVTHRVAVGADGLFQADVHEPVVVEGVDAPGFAWRVEPGADATSLGVVRLTPFGVWVGRVHGSNGRPQPDAVVRAGSGPVATVDEHGDFALPRSEGAEGRRAVATAPGRGIGVVALADAAPGGEVLVAMLVVPDAQEARFRVLDASGAPLAGVGVVRGGHVRRAKHDHVRTTDASGLVSLRPPEDGLVGFLAPDGARYTFEVGTTGPEPVEVRLPTSRSVTLRLAGTGAPPSSFVGVAIVSGGVEPTDRRLRPEGTPIADLTSVETPIVVSGLAVGSAVLRVKLFGFREADVEVPAGATEVTVPLEPVTDAHRARAAAIDAELAGLPPLESIADETARAAEARRREALRDEWLRNWWE